MSVGATCERCRWYQQAEPPRPPLSQDEMQLPGAFEVVSSWRAMEKVRKAQEDQRIAAGIPLLDVPRYHHWCEAHTWLEAVERARHDDDVLRDLLVAGRAKLDPTTGRVFAVYAVCEIDNRNGSCPDHEPIDP